MIAIGQLSNPNNAAKILNLCPDPLLTFTNLLEIYEMYDLTTTEKAERSEKKLNDYRHHFFHITSLEIPNDLKSKYV